MTTVLLVLVVKLLFVLLYMCWRSSSLACTENQTLYIIGLAPFPDNRPSFDPRYPDTGAPGILPAVKLAVQHVNSRPDVLATCRLAVLSGDSGCSVSSKALEVLLEHVFTRRPKQVVGVIGPVCSTSATAIAPILSRREVSLLHFTTAISPKLDIYLNAIKMLGSSKNVISAFLQLMERNNWRRVGALFENEREEFRSTHDIFQRAVFLSNRSVLSLPVTNSHINIEPFERNQTRIIFVFVAADLVSRILCLAHAKNFNLQYPSYQWVIPASQLTQLKATSFTLDGRRVSCTKAEIEQALIGSIVTAFSTNRHGSTDVLESGLNYKQYSAQLEEKMSSSNVSQDPNANVYYDAVWTLALALNKTVHCERTFNLSGYTQGQPEATELLRREVLKLDFEGVSGRIHFDPESDGGFSRLNFFQIGLDCPVRDQMQCTIGFYSSENHSLNINNAFFLDDTFPTEAIIVHPAVGVAVLIIAAIILILTVILHILTVAFRELRAIKATSPNLNHLIFSGCYLFITITVVLILQASFLRSVKSAVLHGVLCSMLGWCISIGYSLVLGTVCVKSFRIYKFFSGFKLHSRVNTGLFLTDHALVFFIILFVTMDVIINISWNVVAPWTLVQREFIADHKILIEAHCECNHLVIWLAVLLVLKVILTVLTIYYSILTRRINRREFKHSKSINILAYALVLLYSFGMPIVVLFSSNLYAYTLTFCFLSLGSVILCQLTLSFRPFYILLSSPRTSNQRPRKITVRWGTTDIIPDSPISSS